MSKDEVQAVQPPADGTGRLSPLAEYGQHIQLSCKNHLQLRWSTKNIAPLGCRTIFFDVMGKSKEPECDCEFETLIVLGQPSSELSREMEDLMDE